LKVNACKYCLLSLIIGI